MSVQPGWYVDPADRDTRRYWDGEGWLGAPIPVDATPPDGPPPPEPPPAPVTPAAPAAHPVGAAAGRPPHSGPSPQAGTHPGHGPQANPGPGWGPQAGPSGWPPPDAQGTPPGAPPGWTPQAGPPGWPPQGVPPGWAPGGPPGWIGRPPEPRPHGLRLAGYGRRLVARLIDFGLVFALNVLVNGWFVWRWLDELMPYWREAFRRGMEGNTSSEGMPPISEQTGLLQVVIVLIATALWLAYEVPAMAANGQTIGKRVMRIRAVPIAADQPLGFGRALTRWTTLGLPTLLWYCAGLGLLLQLVDSLSPLFDHPLRRALHDKRAQTVVVEVPDTPATPAPDDHPQPSGDTP
ncbi:RDD family protein [Micromonospora lupini]|uniref:RDD family protein n=1 Tax=Micromonospora lupini TaxID=285679 RepID=UPI002254BCF2|nr:RDD family protein [Micromonospora lupini]MCX5067995.1 RDD family protein [Micromonospora lupini]